MWIYINFLIIITLTLPWCHTRNSQEIRESWSHGGVSGSRPQLVLQGPKQPEHFPLYSISVGSAPATHTMINSTCVPRMRNRNPVTTTEWTWGRKKKKKSKYQGRAGRARAVQINSTMTNKQAQLIQIRQLLTKSSSFEGFHPPIVCFYLAMSFHKEEETSKSAQWSFKT